MSGASVVPYPTEINQLDISWPLPYAAAVSGAFQVSGIALGGGGTPYGVFNAPVGAGTNVMSLYKGVVCGLFGSDGVGGVVERTLGGFTMFPLITKGAGAGFQLGPFARVWRWQVTIALQLDAAITSESGIAIQPANGGDPGWINSGNRGFGLVGHPAGYWQFVCKNVGGVGVYNYSLNFDGIGTNPAWPAARTEFATVEFQLVSATNASEAALSLFVNNSRIVTLPWGAGTQLPDYTTPAGAARFVPIIRMGNPAVNENLLVAAGMRCTAGRFTVTGGRL